MSYFGDKDESLVLETLAASEVVFFAVSSAARPVCTALMRGLKHFHQWLLPTYSLDVNILGDIKLQHADVRRCVFCLQMALGIWLISTR